MLTKWLRKLDNSYSAWVEERTNFYRDILEFAPNETTTHNNKSDAFKHIFTSATLTLFFGEFIAKYFTNRHEWNNLENKSPIEESIMDFHNNRLGRSIGKIAFKWLLRFSYTEMRLAKVINNYLNTKTAICSLDDERIANYKIAPMRLFETDKDLEHFKKYLK